VFFFLVQQNWISMPYILIVDDDADDRDLFCTAMREVDPSLACIHARDGQEALLGLRLKEFPTPHLIFIDLNMPRLNGFQCLKELKKDRALQNIPVAIYTTSKIREHKEECERLGAAHFITKPTRFTELCTVISDVLVSEMLLSK
jgi:CheY-like chemotaxis protein